MATTAHPVMPFKRRVVLALGVVVITVIPALIMLVITLAGTGKPQAAATWASLPAIAGIVAAASGGRGFAVRVAIVMGLLGPLTIVAGASPVAGAASMALMCLMIGRLSRFGLHKSAVLVPIMMAWPLIDPPTWSGQPTVDRLDTPYLLWMTLIFFVGAMFPALVVPWLMRKRDLPELKPHPFREAIVYTVMITVLVSASTFYVLSHPKLYGGAFLIAAILVLAPVGVAETLRPTVLRIVGTVAGSVLVIGLVSGVKSLTVIYLIGLVLIVVALVLRLGGLAWLYYAFMMPATACLNATSLAQVGQLGEQRAVDNVVGGLLVLAASAIAIAYSNWATKHGDASDADPEVAKIA